MFIPTYQKTYKLAFFLAILLLIGDAILQYTFQVQPCVLVYIERIAMLVLAIVFFAAAMHTHTITTKKVYNWIILLICLLGIFVAGRHVWLQLFSPLHPVLPPEAGTILQTLQAAFIGTPACITIQWEWAGISLAMLTFFCFIFFALIAFLQMFREK